MRSVCSSSSQYSRRSFDDTSALLPIETNDESPRPRPSACSTSAIPRAPLCDENATRPGGNCRPANVAFRRAADEVALGVDGVGGAGVVAAEDVPEELASDRAASRRSADDRDRPWREERREAAGDRDVVALVDRRANLLGLRDREPHLDDTSLESPGRREARV